MRLLGLCARKRTLRQDDTTISTSLSTTRSTSTPRRSFAEADAIGRTEAVQLATLVEAAAAPRPRARSPYLRTATWLGEESPGLGCCGAGAGAWEAQPGRGPPPRGFGRSRSGRLQGHGDRRRRGVGNSGARDDLARRRCGRLGTQTVGGDQDGAAGLGQGTAKRGRRRCVLRLNHRRRPPVLWRQLPCRLLPLG